MQFIKRFPTLPGQCTSPVIVFVDDFADITYSVIFIRP